MSDRSEETPEIKIIDRRSFTSDGQRRTPDESGSAGASEKPDAASGAPPAAKSPPAAKPAPGEPAARGEGFTMHGPPDAHEGAPGEAETAFLNLWASSRSWRC